MKIKNQISKSTIESIVGLLIAIIATTLIVIVILICTCISWDCDIIQAVILLLGALKGSNRGAYIAVTFALTIFEILFIGLFVSNVINRIRDIKKLKESNTDFILFFDFQEDGVTLVYNSGKNIFYSYSDIDRMEFQIKTMVVINKYGPRTYIESVTIDFESNGQKYSLFWSPISTIKFYNLFYYAKKVKSFYYEILGNGDYDEIRSSIEKHIKNDYNVKKTITDHIVQVFCVVFGMLLILFIYVMILCKTK